MCNRGNVMAKEKSNFADDEIREASDSAGKRNGSGKVRHRYSLGQQIRNALLPMMMKFIAPYQKLSKLALVYFQKQPTLLPMIYTKLISKLVPKTSSPLLLATTLFLRFWLTKDNQNYISPTNKAANFIK